MIDDHYESYDDEQPPPEIQEALLEKQTQQEKVINLHDRRLNILSVAKLIEQYPTDDPPVIDGLLRLGETMNVIASPKVGKTWLAAGMAFSIANGLPWMGMQCTKGRVLILDCELKPRTLRFRYQRVASEMKCDTNSLDGNRSRVGARTGIDLRRVFVAKWLYDHDTEFYPIRNSAGDRGGNDACRQSVCVDAHVSY